MRYRRIESNSPRSSTRVASTAVLLTALLLGCGVADDDGHDGHDAVSEPVGQEHTEHAPTDRQEEEAHEHEDGMIRVSDELAHRLGVTFEEARTEDLERTIRGTGEVTWDETRLSVVSLRFGGWAERLHADFTGRLVEAGEPLLEVYSPELVSAQEDLLAAARLAGTLASSRVPGSSDRGRSVVEAARERLRYWNVSDDDIRAVEESGEVQPHLTLPAPFTGYVVEKRIQAGERFESGSTLYRLADLSQVWIDVDVYERDLRFVHVGTPVEVEVAAYPGEPVQGEVAYVYPEVERDRRTARVRIELLNPAMRLKPGMYGTARARVVVAEDAVTVPRDAVMHTGERSLVFVAHGEGSYENRTIQIGAEAGGRTQVLSGLEEGELVVARAGFILDAESRLMDAMMGQPGMPGMEMDMDEPGMEMDMDEQPEHDHGGHDAGGPDA